MISTVCREVFRKGRLKSRWKKLIIGIFPHWVVQSGDFANIVV
ncbi:MAG: hypothetical protein ABW007_26445 [Chitinophagaceae bacterium]